MSRPANRKGKFIAVANMKGGVGKTTTVVSLAEALAANDESKKVLVIDLDPQASASVAIAGDEELSTMIENGHTFETLLEYRFIDEANEVSIVDFIHSTICATWHKDHQLAVSLLPCGPKLRLVERNLLYELGRRNGDIDVVDERIARFFVTDILPLAQLYDYIIFDCAPGISPVTEAAIKVSDLVLVPTIPDRISVYGLNAFYENVWNSGSPPNSMPSVVIVRMNRGIRQHMEVLEGLEGGAAEDGAGYRLLATQIPTSAALVEALMKSGYLTFVQKYTSAVISTILNPLVKEVRGLL